MIEEKEQKNDVPSNAPNAYNMDEDDLGIARYIQPKRQQTKFWLWVFLFAVLALMVFIYKTTIIDTTIPPEELKASMKIFNIDSQWVENEKIDTPDYKGILVVPEITFQVRNVGEKDLRYVYFLGVFRLFNRPKPIGEDFFMAFKKTLEPGKVSEFIKLKSKFGYRATSKKAFAKFKKDWRSSKVELFVKSGTSKLFPLKTYFISRRIEGVEIDVSITGKTLGEINETLAKPNKNKEKQVTTKNPTGKK